MVTTILNLALPAGDSRYRIEIDGYVADTYSEDMSEPNFEEVAILGRSPLQIYTNSGARSVSFSMTFHRDMFASSEEKYGGVAYTGQPTINTYQGLYTTVNNRQSRADSYHQQLNQYMQYLEESAKALSIEKKNMILRRGKDDNQIYIKDKTSRLLTVTAAGEKAVDEMNKISATANFKKFIESIKALNYPIYATNGVVAPYCYVKIGNTIRLKGYAKTKVTYENVANCNELIWCTVDFTFTEVVDQSWSATEVMEGMQRYVRWIDNIYEVR